MRRALIFIGAFICLSLSVAAQSNGDKLFMEGQKLQQTQTVSSQNQAIKKFMSAKVVYTTTDKKTMCDNQIEICKKNIAMLRSNSASSTTSATTTQTSTATTETAFALSQNEVKFDGDNPGECEIDITAPTYKWSYNVQGGIEGEDSFTSVYRNPSNEYSLKIKVTSNPTTLERRQTVKVTYETLTEVIQVTQSGKTVTLGTSTNTLEYGLKGGSKSMELYTNSDLIVEENNNEVWYIESKPDWIDIKVSVQKDKSMLGKGVSAIKGLVSSKATAASADDVKTISLQVTASSIAKTDADYNTGRKGELVFASQDKRYKVSVVQQK